jgi:FkbH-like protein
MSTTADLRRALGGESLLRSFTRGWLPESGAPVGELLAVLDAEAPADVAARWGAALLAQAGRHEEAIARWEAWLAHAEAPPAWHLAQLARSYDRRKDSAGVFRTAARLHPWDLEAEPRAAVGRLLRKARERGVPPGYRTAKVALLSTFTLDLVEPHLRVVAAGLGVDLDLYVADFDQLRTEIVDRGSRLYAHDPEVVILATSWRDVDERPADQQAADWKMLWDELLAGTRAHVLLHTFDRPPTGSAGHLENRLGTSRRRRAAELNLLLADHVPDRVSLVDYDHAVFTAGAAQWTDHRQWFWAKEAVPQAQLPVLAEEYGAVLRALWGKTRKVLVLDLDNTLWGGVVGEDGVAGLRLGPPNPEGEAHQAVQRYAKELSSRGVLLTVCTKNNPDDARAPFLESADMVLTLDDIVAFESSWEPKPVAIARMAKRLELGLDSFVFLDDNPVERAAVRASLPEVLVIPVPADIAGYVEALHRARAFEALAISDEDRLRTASYRAEEGRKELAQQVASPEAFLRSLDMVASVRAFLPADLTRIVQLAARSNQFNLTTWRMTAAEVESLAASPDHFVCTVRLRDRFGDYGLVLVLVAEVQGAALDVRAWFMSCRVLGRRMEELASWLLDRAAAARGCTVVRGHYLPTKKNVLVKPLFGRLGFERAGGDDADEVWERPVRGAAPVDVLQLDE